MNSSLRATLAGLRRRARARFGRLRRGTRPITPLAYAASGRGGYFHRTLAAAFVHRSPLPGNVDRRGDLRRDRDPWGFSFHDVPARAIEPRAIARLPECRITPWSNPHGSVFHSVRTPGGRELRLRNSGPPPGQDLTPLGAGPAVDCGEAAWIVRRWHRNYYHWVVDHLTQVLVLQEWGVEKSILIPGPGPLRPLMIESLQALGLEPADLRSAPAGPWRADPTWVVESDRVDPPLLQALRARLAGGGGPPNRRVYLGREGARKRRLANPDPRGIFDAAGFEVVEPEGMGFLEQVALASETAVLVGIHGAALANMVFMPAGGHVVEIVHPGYPSPAYYVLASALGLRYWLLWGKPADGRGPAALDMEFDPRDLERVVAAIEATG